MVDENDPSIEEIVEYIEKVVWHSRKVEYYLKRLNVRANGEERPHDLVGSGNKLEWVVLRGLALKKRDTEEKQKRYFNAIEIHRGGQKHHQKWDRHIKATEDDMKYGAIDSILSLREKRDYQGGNHSWQEIEEIIEQNPKYKRKWMKWAMEKIKYAEENEKHTRKN